MHYINAYKPSKDPCGYTNTHSSTGCETLPIIPVYIVHTNYAILTTKKNTVQVFVW